MPGGGVADVRAATWSTAFLAKTPKTGQALAAVCTANARFAAALPTPRVAPGAPLSRVWRQRAPWITPAACETHRNVNLYS